MRNYVLTVPELIELLIQKLYKLNKLYNTDVEVRSLEVQKLSDEITLLAADIEKEVDGGYPF